MQNAFPETTFELVVREPIDRFRKVNEAHFIKFWSFIAIIIASSSGIFGCGFSGLSLEVTIKSLAEFKIVEYFW